MRIDERGIRTLSLVSSFTQYMPRVEQLTPHLSILEVTMLCMEVEDLSLAP